MKRGGRRVGHNPAQAVIRCLLPYGVFIGLVPPAWIMPSRTSPPADDRCPSGPARDLPLSRRERRLWAALEETLRR